MATLAIGLCCWPLASGRGQEGPATPDATVDPIRGLVAPIALYPDPLLAAVLQASLFPIDVVQADRFLEQHAQDQTLEPSPDWDAALIALLNYPSVIDDMNTHLDWTEAMGDAVYDQLEAVQFAIQDLRMAAYSMGILASNEMQAVVVDEGIVAIRPASPEQIAIPEYDGFALLEALETVPATASTEAPVDTAAPAETETSAEPAVEAAAEPAPEEPTAEAAPVEPAPVESAPAEPLPAEPLPAETAPVDSYAYAAEPAPTYAAAPVYAAPPPPVTYAPPTSSYWGTAATFAGGAIIGGILGYAIADDDDDDIDIDWDDGDWDGDNWNGGGRDINIEDSNIVVGGGGNVVRRDRTDVSADLRQRRDRTQVASSRRERPREGIAVAALPQSGAVAERRQRSDTVALPARGREAAPRIDRPARQQQQAMRAPQQQRGALADVKRPSETRRAAERGQVSRERAGQRQAAAPQRQVQRASPQRQAAASGDRGGDRRGALAPRGGQREAKAQRDRGSGSRGGGRRGRR
jgi:hypothetical protein